jgi:glycosyltransferase involved in cell wall biosynthesis
MASHARLFAARGYEVTIIAGRGPVAQGITPGIRTVIEPLIDSKGERLQKLNAELDKGIVPLDFMDFMDEIYQKLQTLLEGYSFCFVHNALTLHKNLPLTAALVRMSTTLPVKLISWCHDLAWTNTLYQPVLYDKFPWSLLRQTSPNITYVAISEQRQQEILETFSPKLTAAQVPIVPNGVSMDEFLGIAPETSRIVELTGIAKALREGALLLLLPSRITRRKNIEMGVATMAAIKAEGRDARLIVTGPPGPHNPRNDEYVQELINQAKDLKVREEVIFLMERWREQDGRPRTLSDRTIADLFRYCDAMFFPSLQEGFGIPILEAGLARLPIFCTDIPPFKQLATGYANFFSKDDTPQMVARFMLQELEQNSLYRMRREVLSNYVWDSVFEHQIEPLVSK